MGGILDTGDMWILALVFALVGGVTVIWLREKRFERAERREDMKEMRGEMKKMHGEMKKMHAKLDATIACVEKLDGDVKRLDAKVEAHQTATINQFRELNKKVGNLFERMASTEGLVQGLQIALSHLGLVRQQPSSPPSEPSEPSEPSLSPKPPEGARRSGRAGQEVRP